MKWPCCYAVYVDKWQRMNVNINKEIIIYYHLATWIKMQMSEWVSESCDIKNVSLWGVSCMSTKKRILIYMCIPFAYRQLPWQPYHTTTVHAISETTLPDHWIMNKSEAGFPSYSVFVFYSLHLHNSIQKTDPVWWPSGELLRRRERASVHTVIVHENRGLSR